MPAPLTPASALRLTRRAVLTGAVGAAAAGCTGGLDGDGAGRRRGPGARRPRDAARTAREVDRDVALAGAALADLEGMLRALEATSAHHGDLAPALGPVTEAHRRHVEVLAEAAPQGPAGSRPTDREQGRQWVVPRRTGRALRRLTERETALSTELRRHAFVADSGAFARLLASIAASAAQNAAVLAELDAAGGGRR